MTDDGRKRTRLFILMGIMAALLIALILSYVRFGSSAEVENLSYEEFIDRVSRGTIRTAVIEGDVCRGRSMPGEAWSYYGARMPPGHFTAEVIEDMRAHIGRVEVREPSVFSCSRK